MSEDIQEGVTSVVTLAPLCATNTGSQASTQIEPRHKPAGQPSATKKSKLFPHEPASVERTPLEPSQLVVSLDNLPLTGDQLPIRERLVTEQPPCVVRSSGRWVVDTAQVSNVNRVDLSAPSAGPAAKCLNPTPPHCSAKMLSS